MNTTQILITVDSAFSLLAWVSTLRGNNGLAKLFMKGHNALAFLMTHRGEVNSNDGTQSGSDSSE